MAISTAALVLAAGRSSRMGAGRHKLLLPLGDRPVLAHVLDMTLASDARPLVVVLGHQAQQVRAILSHYTEQRAITILDNPTYQQGMSTSLRVGIAYLMTLSPTVTGAFILLGDQPLIHTETLTAMLALKETTGKRIIVVHDNGKRGNPTLIDASLFPELLTTSGDEGGRKILERYPHETATLARDDATQNYDVDTWDAYQQVVALWEQQQ